MEFHCRGCSAGDIANDENFPALNSVYGMSNCTCDKYSDANETRVHLSYSSSSLSGNAWRETTRQLWLSMSLQVPLEALSRMLVSLQYLLYSTRTDLAVDTLCVRIDIWGHHESCIGRYLYQFIS